MTDVVLAAVDDVITAEVLGRTQATRRSAEGFPRREDRNALEARERGADTYLVVAGGEVVGTCGTHGALDDAGCIEVGFGIVESARGKGVGASAVAQLVVEVRAKHPAATIIARTQIEQRGDGAMACSPASDAILRGLGFTIDETASAQGVRAWRLTAS